MENFFEGDVNGNIIILYSRIEELFFKLSRDDSKEHV